MTSNEIREKFLKFFKKKGHKIVPSSSLIPGDTTVLFTSAGMQQFIPYLSGKVKPPYKRACSVQKCFRINDIDEVGDEVHHTFFEMLGNWSFGDYFKEEAIDYALEFLVKECGLVKDRLWVTVFGGEDGIPKDKEAVSFWQEKGIPKEKISEFGMKENFWGPVGAIGPCGPSSEIHYDKTEKPCAKGKDCVPNCECGRFVEIWNLVFMQYNKNEKGEYELLAQKNIDTGIGFERLTAVMQNKPSAYETDLFLPIIQKIEELAAVKYCNQPRFCRIIADHTRASVFSAADGIIPSNLERGYVLRRLLRRVIRFGKILKLPDNFLIPLALEAIKIYKEIYPEVGSHQPDILTIIKNEEEKFEKTLERGIKQFEKLLISKEAGEKRIISGEETFNLYETYGFPLELTQELAEEKGFEIDEKKFREEFKKHQEISRAGAEKKFGGHAISEAANGEARLKMTKLHTATHLLHQALRDVLGDSVRQMGSDINPERLRFDFSHPEKLTPEQIQRVEEILNQKIKDDLPVKKEEMPYEEAIKSGALAFFKEKYPKIVNVYFIGDWSKEICAGPHVERTGGLGKFRIVREESSAAGIRRIKAVLE